MYLPVVKVLTAVVVCQHFVVWEDLVADSTLVVVALVGGHPPLVAQLLTHQLKHHPVRQPVVTAQVRKVFANESTLGTLERLALGKTSQNLLPVNEVGKDPLNSKNSQKFNLQVSIFSRKQQNFHGLGIIHLKIFEFSNFQKFGRSLFQFSKFSKSPLPISNSALKST